MTEGPITSITAPGVKVDPNEVYHLRRAVASLLKRQQFNFPGAQPVSFARKHLAELHNEDYFVCEKSDGIRYLLWFTSGPNAEGQVVEKHYLIDRKNEYWWANATGQLHFPLPGNVQEFHTDTLIDGELVMDTHADGRREPRFLVFDCMIMDKMDLRGRTLDKRLGYFKENVMKPYTDLYKHYPDERQYRAFVVEAKEMQVAYGVEMMFRDVLPHLKHGNDGLIFTCRTSRYQHGTDPNILKWKPASENTIDFRLRLHFPLVEPDDEERAEGATEPFVDYISVPRADLLIFMGDGRDKYQVFGSLYLTEEEWEELMGLNDPLSNRVVECGLDEQNRWRLHRFRDDKNEANHISTARSVVESIADSVSQQDLLDAATGIRQQWKTRQAQQQQGGH